MRYILFGASCLIFLANCASTYAQSQASLTVNIGGLRNYKGRVILYLWPESEEIAKFPDPSKVQFRDEHDNDTPCEFPKTAVCRRTIESLQNLTATYTFRNLPIGDYAIYVVHDENGNGIQDKGLLGRSLEARGYSQILPEDIHPIASRIAFKQAKFTLTDRKTLTIGLRYPPRL